MSRIALSAVQKIVALIGIALIVLGLVALLSPTLFRTLLMLLPENTEAIIRSDMYGRDIPMSWSLIIVGAIVLWVRFLVIKED